MRLFFISLRFVSLLTGNLISFRFIALFAVSMRSRKSRSSRAGLKFPVVSFEQLLRKGNYAERVGDTAPVFLAAVIEYLASEVLDLAGSAASHMKKDRITPRHLMLGIHNDVELNKLLYKVIIAHGGVVPHIHYALLEKSSK